MPETIATKIAGIFKYPDAKETMKFMAAGDGLHFEAEPSNPYDSNAIALFVKTKKLESPPEDLSITDGPTIKCGYIPRDHAAKLKDKKIISVQKGAAFDSITIEFE